MGNNTIAFGKDTVLKRIANCLRTANRSLTRKEVDHSIQKEDCLRTGILSKASGKILLYASYKAIIKAAANINVERFYKLFYYELPLHKGKVVALQTTTAFKNNCRGLAV